MAFNFDNFQRLVAAEADNQPIEGQNAVAAVILNRMASGQFPDSFHAVASQKNQFEPWRKFGGFKNMPSLPKSQKESLRSFVSSYTPQTDPTGGALFFQNPTITAERGTEFAQPNGIKIGDQVFSRTFGGKKDADSGSKQRVNLAKQNILKLTKGHRTEAEGRKIVSTFGDNEIIAASDKFDQLINNLNPVFSNGDIPLEQIDMTGAAGLLPQKPSIDRVSTRARSATPPVNSATAFERLKAISGQLEATETPGGGISIDIGDMNLDGRAHLISAAGSAGFKGVGVDRINGKMVFRMDGDEGVYSIVGDTLIPDEFNTKNAFFGGQDGTILSPTATRDILDVSARREREAAATAARETADISADTAATRIEGGLAPEAQLSVADAFDLSVGGGTERATAPVIAQIPTPAPTPTQIAAQTPELPTAPAVIADVSAGLSPQPSPVRGEEFFNRQLERPRTPESLVGEQFAANVAAPIANLGRPADNIQTAPAQQLAAPVAITPDRQVASVSAPKPAGTPKQKREIQVQNLHDAYNNKQMTPEHRALYEQGIQSGEIPRQEVVRQVDQGIAIPEGVMNAYNSGAMTPEHRAQLEQAVQKGEVFFTEQQGERPTIALAQQGERPLVSEEGIKRGAELATRDVLTGLESALGIVYNPIAVLMNQALSNEDQIPMLGQRINEVLTKEGFAQPATMTEEIISRVSEAVTGAATTIGIAGAVKPAVDGLTRLVTSAFTAQPIAQVTGAATGELAAEGVKAAGGGEVAQTVAGITGAIFGGSKVGARPKATPTAEKIVRIEDDIGTLVSKASAGSRKAGVQLAEKAKTNIEAKEAAERLGIELPIDVFSDETIVRQAAGLTRSKIGSEASAIWEETVKKAVNKADEVALKLADNKSISEISADVKKSLDNSLTTIKRGERKLYESVKESVGARTKIDPINTRDYLANKAEDLGGIGKLDAAERELFLDITNGKNRPNYGLIDSKIKKINAAQGGKQNLFADSDSFDLGELVSNLRRDRLEHVELFGGKGVSDKLVAAHELTSRKKEIQKSIIAGFGKDEQGSIVRLLSKSINDAAQGDISGLNKVLNVIPQDLQKEALLSAINKSATGTIGGEKVFGFSQFVKFYSGLRQNPPLFSKIHKIIGKEASDTLRDLFSVSKRITDARSKVLTTGKANQPLVEAMRAENVVKNILQSSVGGKAVRSGAAVAGGAALGTPGVAGGLMVAEFLTKGGKDKIAAAGKLFNSEEFKLLVSDVAANPAKYRQNVKKVSKSKAFINWAKSTKISNPENWLLGVIFGSQSDNEKEALR